MPVIVNVNDLLSIIEAVKKLPVQGNFDDADRWVGIVIALEAILQNAQSIEESKNGEDGEEVNNG